MAQLNPLLYRFGTSVLFNLDVRCKVASVCLMSIAVAQADFTALAFITSLLFIFLHISGLTLSELAHDLRYFFVFLGVIFIVRSIVTPGTSNLFTFFIPGITVSMEGIIDGAKICWRFMAVMIMGTLFSATIRPSDLKGAVEWFLKPLPFIPEKRAGVMVSLFIRFLPLILQKAGEVSDARKARCVHLQKSPFKRMAGVGIPVLEKIFRSADTLAAAMESRCYSDERREKPFHPSGNEPYFYTISIVILIITVIY
ncbi:CbiQ2 [Desulfamplus magnetovallimortis]|uniref:CbiQ2 n=1 Tax=Desulfamplus magnetovallimortis TaxID=1246637 RepID=A0A1W1H768_9BACT|nr:energy-coupling factor transporter transmembrane component T [Desulfamplus magnetovallimortis]SLM28235.1 CbiQ2 [Desulfamplus magnetovallimortis]